MYKLQCLSWVMSYTSTKNLHYDENQLILDLVNDKVKILSCKENSPCLGAYDTHHFITLGIKSKQTISCDLSHCKECELNKNSTISDIISKKIELSNTFLKSLNIPLLEISLTNRLAIEEQFLIK